MHEYAAAVARFFVVGLSGPRLNEHEMALLEAYPPSGVIFFERNVEDLDQLSKLAGDVTSIIFGAGRGGMKPIISADHEGGRISVLFNALGVPPSQMALARCGDLNLCRSVYSRTAEMLISVGINTLLAPVVDVNSERFNPVIGTRSFGTKSDEVVPFVTESVEALKEAGVEPCLKHFPGHGASLSDSHVALPRISKSVDEMMGSDLLCFRKGFDAGADMVMVGHLLTEGFERPASLSEDFVKEVLRRRLSFEGLAITDALEMQGAVPRDGPNASAFDVMDPHSTDLFCSQLELALRADDLLLYASPIERVYAQLERCFVDFPERMRRLARFAAYGNVDSIERIERFRGRLDGGHKITKHGAGVDEREREDSYRQVARCIVTKERASSGGKEPFCKTAGGVLFFGGGEDFTNGVVRNFIHEISISIGRRTSGTIDEAAKEDERKNDIGHEGSLGAGEGIFLERVDRREGVWSEYSALGDVYVIKPYERSSGAPREERFHLLAVEGNSAGGKVLFVLNRRPFRSEVIAGIIEHFGVIGVVFAGWPYAGDSLAFEIPKVVTYDIYDGLAEVFLEKER